MKQKDLSLPNSTNANLQIIKAYEEYGMTPAEIAESFEWEIFSIKQVLAVHSEKFRREVKRDSEQDITREQYLQILEGYINLALNSEVDAVRERASKNLMDEYKGRKKSFIKPGARINIVQINQHLREAKKDLAEILATESGQTLLVDQDE